MVETSELSSEILKFLSENYPEKLKEKYSIDNIPADKADLLPVIAKKRGYVLKGGEPDTERTAKSIIQDFRKQAFGKIILEKI